MLLINNHPIFVFFCPVEGNGEQNNRLSLKLPDSAIPASQYALLTVIGGSKTSNSFRLMFTTIIFLYLNFVNCIVCYNLGNLIGPSVSNIIDGRGLDSIIKMPTGCGEQTMLKLAPNVFVFNYLRSTKQVTQQIEETAFNFIRSGKYCGIHLPSEVWKHRKELGLHVVVK